MKQLIINDQRQRNVSLEEAAEELVRGMGLTDRSVVDCVVAAMRREAGRLQILDIPTGVHGRGYREAIVEDAKELLWYTGPRDSDQYWGQLRAQLESGNLASVLPEIDAASTKVVAHFADPGIRRLKKKGLVLGHVQSGKTANYTAVMAKSADAGYRLFIVLSGLHNNLRRQTQARLDRDLGVENWTTLTDEDRDFGSVLHGQALLQNPQMRTVAVVKKNAMRLRRLRNWLRDIDESVRAQAPILLLDDEADQATPNSRAAQEEMSRINELIREIWEEIPTGSYVGYTATPFANIFMDPDDPTEMYPSDFILDLPRSADYFGAERVFGRQAVQDAADPDPGLDMVRTITEAEAVALRPPRAKEARSSFDPEAPESLVDAVTWFLLATCIRRLRHEIDHSSMLVHTTSYVAPHFALADKIEQLLFTFRQRLEDDDLTVFRRCFEEEVGRVTGVNDQPIPSWDEVAAVLVDVLEEAHVVVDNGLSEDRLDYARKTESGRLLTETVIAVGGGTLSRGLTLEGLIVSYFARTSNTYDTLLQMGRWFGYRPGYEDLPRIWMTEDLAADFTFLATVEEELRVEIRRLERLGVTPQQMGLRVRAHPGRLSITAPNRMYHARLVHVSFAGQRHQTFILYEKQSDILAENIEATRTLAVACEQTGHRGSQSPARRQFLDVDVDAVLAFVREYHFHPDQGLRSDHVADWIERYARATPWNVVFIGTDRQHRGADGMPVDLGNLNVGLDTPLPLVNRAPLSDGRSGRANIKALLSIQDWTADLDAQTVTTLRRDNLSWPEIRSRIRPEAGLLMIYGVSDRSVPLRSEQAKTRRPMQASLPIVGVGIVFPELPAEDLVGDGDYIAVEPSWNARVDEEVEELPEDGERSANVDAEDLIRGEL